MDEPDALSTATSGSEPAEPEQRQGGRRGNELCVDLCEAAREIVGEEVRNAQLESLKGTCQRAECREVGVERARVPVEGAVAADIGKGDVLDEAAEEQHVAIRQEGERATHIGAEGVAVGVSRGEAARAVGIRCGDVAIARSNEKSAKPSSKAARDVEGSKRVTDPDESAIDDVLRMLDEASKLESRFS